MSARTEAARRWLTGPQLVVAVVGAWTVALRPLPAPMAGALVAVGIVILLVGRRRPAGLVAVAVATVSLHAGVARSAAADPPVPAEVAGAGVLVSDPSGTVGATSAAIEVQGIRYQATATGAVARPLRAMVSGEHVVVRGRPRGLDADDGWLVDRHVVARLELQSLDDWSPASGALGWANRFRALLWSGASSLDDDERALFAGLVTGDDRALSALDADAFTTAGLTHLTAVSGQNVAFVLIVVHPVVRWLPWRWRAVVVLAVLGGFTLVTRAEPSVLRAVAMAGFTTLAVATGRPTSGLRHLALAAVALLAVDPLLAGRPGFVLSVVASGGILAAAGRIGDRLRGPRAWRDGLGVTLAAQVATAPVLAAVFGGVPLVALPANVLAVPIAGAVMVYGLVAGTAAGIAGRLGAGWLAALLQRPTGVALGALQGIADLAARAPDRPLGLLAASLVAVGSTAVVLGWAAPCRWRRVAGRGGGLLVAATLAGTVLGVPALGPGSAGSAELDGVAAGPGAAVWRGASSSPADADVVVLDGRADAERVLRALRRSGIRRVDLLVVRSSAPAATAAAAAVTRRLDVAHVVRRDGAPPSGPVAVGGWWVDVRHDGDGPWAVEVTARGPAGSVGPSG